MWGSICTSKPTNRMNVRDSSAMRSTPPVRPMPIRHESRSGGYQKQRRRSSHTGGIRAFDLDTRPETVTGVTVVSSVDRGAADVDLDGGEILFTTGFPALSPVQGLTHGVHGIGDRVAVSVTTSPEIMPDVDRYMDLLRAGFDAPRR